MADLNANDKMLLECIRGEFNNQPRDERIRVADFMDYEAAQELLREREHAMANVRRIDRRIATVIESIRKRRADGVPVMRHQGVSPADAHAPAPLVSGDSEDGGGR